MTFIDHNTPRDVLVKLVDENLNDIIDAFIQAGVDPRKETTPTEDIFDVIVQWIEDGDECG